MVVARKKRLSRCWISWLGDERKDPYGDYKKGRVTGTFRCCQDEMMDFSRMENKKWKHPSDFTDVVCLVDGLDETYRYRLFKHVSLLFLTK